MKKQKINLKEYVDEKKITLREISDQTGIKESILDDMYSKGEFDGNIIFINNILDLMTCLGIDKVDELVPSIK